MLGYLFQGSIPHQILYALPHFNFFEPHPFLYLSHSECLIQLMFKYAFAIKYTSNPSVPNASVPNLPPQNIRKPLTFCGCFQGKEKGCIGNEWVNSENTY